MPERTEEILLTVLQKQQYIIFMLNTKHYTVCMWGLKARVIVAYLASKMKFKKHMIVIKM